MENKQQQPEQPQQKSAAEIQKEKMNMLLKAMMEVLNEGKDKPQGSEE